MSLYAEYMEEREGLLTEEAEDGFCVYQIRGTTCWIVDIYVRPSARKLGYATTLADVVVAKARAVGCKTLLGSVSPETRGATASLKVLLAYGFELAGYDQRKGLIMFKKEI